MIALIITFFLSIIIALVFVLFKKEDIVYVIKDEKIDDEDFTDRYASLNDDQINFYFEQGQKKLENVLRQRDNENSSLLGHAAIAAGAFSLFFIIGKWAFHHHSDFIVFLPLVAFLSFAFLEIIGNDVKDAACGVYRLSRVLQNFYARVFKYLLYSVCNVVR